MTRLMLRYGENPNQDAYLISNSNKIYKYQLSGKPISYNNIIDLDSGLTCLNEFTEPTAIIVKHTNPCGVASSYNIENAYKKAYLCDSKSAFGGVVLLNRKINLRLAKILSKKFFEIIVAPDFDENSLKALRLKKNLIILKISKTKKLKIDKKTTVFGDIYQKRDLEKINKNFIKLMSKKKITDNKTKDLIFSIKVAKHLKSNAIVLTSNRQTIGLGNGQTNRIDSLVYALKNMKKNFKNKKFVCVSDGFFPFTDSISLLKKYRCSVIAQPFGSLNDKKIIEYAIKYKISLFSIKNRLFKH